MGRVRHGKSDTKEYQAWDSMRDRCNDPKHADYKNYGGRGIRVCDEWNHPEAFIRFFADVGPAPSARHSLNRIENDKGYIRGNVEWATQKQQMRNFRGNRLVTAKGETKPLVTWVEELGLRYTTIHERLRRGWTPEEALFSSPRKNQYQ